VISHVDVEEFAAVMLQDNEDEEQMEGEGGDHEEVDRDDVSGITPTGARIAAVEYSFCRATHEQTSTTRLQEEA
jgi:hypothetical protein